MKKIVLVIASLVLTLLCFTSCDISSLIQKPETENKIPENLIFNETSELYLVYDPESVPVDYANKLTDALMEIGIFPRTVSIGSDKQEHEILLGKTDRDLSDTAYARLDRLDKNTDNDVRYCIYSDGSSVAIAYDEDYYHFTLDAVIDCFLANYAVKELTLARGVAQESCYNLYEYLEEKDTEYFTKKWEALGNAVGTHGDAIVAAFKNLYELYDGDALIRWYSNLYDPSICVCTAIYGATECQKDNAICGTGAFYYSNSARDNAGFLPDAESTAQALSFLGNCGIASGIGGNYKAVVPDWMAEQIVDFIYNLQDPDGFFYHPQWGKNITTSRRGRDYNWCIGILETYGKAKKYDSVVDASAMSVTDGNITGRLGSSVFATVSKVALAESETLIPDHLKTLDAFKQYLIDLDIPHKSYSAGNTLSAQGSQIAARGAEYGEALIEHLNACQYDNGIWHEKTDYYGINGLMKISGSYGRFNAEIPNAEIACRAAFAAIGSSEDVKDVVDIWNPWVAINNVLSNIKKYGGSNGPEKAQQIRSDFMLEAAQAIIDTKAKLSLFLKEDGSFSYQQTHSSATSQGAPAAVPGTNEGDVNATDIATTHTVHEIFNALELSSYRVPLCYTSERAVFYETVCNLTPVEKEGISSPIGDPINFDYDNIGEEPFEVEFSKHGKATVIEDERGNGNVLKIESEAGGGDNLLITNTGVGNLATCQVFEGEFCFLNINEKNDLFRFEFGQGGDNINCYRINLRISGNTIKFYDNSSYGSYKQVSNNLGCTAKVGEWFKLRVEYYVGTHDTVRIKVYMNDKLVTVTDNYYDYLGTKVETGVGTPSSRLKNTRIYILKDCAVSLLCDNLHSYATKDDYVAEQLHEEYKNNLNVDAALFESTDSE